MKYTPDFIRKFTNSGQFTAANRLPISMFKRGEKNPKNLKETNVDIMRRTLKTREQPEQSRSNQGSWSCETATLHPAPWCHPVINVFVKCHYVKDFYAKCSNNATWLNIFKIITELPDRVV